MRAAVVGAGPAGFYSAQALWKRFPRLKIDILEQFPVPFGLVRYGVAPDHPATKNVISGFTNFIEANETHIRFIGNVPTLNAKGLHLADLNDLYDVVVLGTGASHPRTLPNIELPASGAYSAHDLIFWINGHPSAHDHESRAAFEGHPTMSSIVESARKVDVIGLGNVAIDVARLLLRPVDDLRGTDISPRALDSLSAAKIDSVSLIGRRSPRFASWTTAALREVTTKIPGIITRCNHALLQRDAAIEDSSRATKRMLKLLIENSVDCRQDVNVVSRDEKELRLEFLLETKSVSRKGSATVLELVERESGPIDGNNKIVALGKHPVVRRPTDALILSLGYTGGSGDGARVGWANGTGKGIIGDNKWDAETLVKQLPDLVPSSAKRGIDDWLQENNWETVSWKGWKRIDEEECRRGLAFGHGRKRVKVECVDEMLHIARGASPLSASVYQ